MNDFNNSDSKRPEDSLNDFIIKISELQDMPFDVVKKLIEAQGSLKDSEFAKKTNESKNNP
ncbi:MAG: hypothetical protein M5U17_09790 [Ignavibacterium sp.]|nr:hypothetical protein [Ignavibacterium sp.]